MILTYSHWQDIRASFSEDEKTDLRCAITGEAICPRGWVIDQEKLDAGLKQKLVEAVRKVKAAHA
jgi:hypothetical protein